MKQLKSFGAFWYDFIVGDDWHVAALVVAGLALTAIITHAAKVNAWWLLPCSSSPRSSGRCTAPPPAGSKKPSKIKTSLSNGP